MRQNSKLKKYILLGICGILTVSSILMTIEGATSSIEVANLQKEQANLADKRRFLENSLVKTLSVGQLEEKSLELGYTKPSVLVYVAPDASVAQAFLK